MTRDEYIKKVTELKSTLDAGGIQNSILINPVGASGTSLGKDRVRIEHKGFVLAVGSEEFFFLARSVKRGFRYRIHGPGQDPYKDEFIIRVQSPRSERYENNAHFGPNFLVDHFDEPLWPAWLQDPDLTKAYDLFSRIVDANGDLPEPFRSAR